MAKTVQCDFCWHMCTLAPGERGICGIRENRDGSLVTLGWGEIVASGIDPIEKKPLYHVYPGKKTYSIALFGCNLRCQFCQNHHISQPDSPYRIGGQRHFAIVQTSAEAVVEKMDEADLSIMSYTYSDPIVWQDYMLSVAQLVHDRKKINCMVTNGSFSEASLQRVLPYIDAFNIDVKGDENFYRKLCKGSLQPVLHAVETIAAQSDKVLEVTTLLIEGYHNPAMIKQLGQQLVERGVKVWHLSRFFPHYRMQSWPPTAEEFLQEMLLIAEDVGIEYVYAGNSALETYDQTYCPACRATLIHSHSYSGEAAIDTKEHIIDGKCRYCGRAIYGFF